MGDHTGQPVVFPLPGLESSKVCWKKESCSLGECSSCSGDFILCHIEWILVNTNKYYINYLNLLEAPEEFMFGVLQDVS